MINNIKKYMNLNELKKMFSFGSIGILNTTVDYTIFFLLSSTFTVDERLAQVISYSTATVFSYFMNKRFTFKTMGFLKGKEFVKFIVVNLISMSLSVLGIHIFYSVWGIDKVLSKIMIGCITVFINFLGNRFWVFIEEEIKEMKE